LVIAEGFINGDLSIKCGEQEFRADDVAIGNISIEGKSGCNGKVPQGLEGVGLVGGGGSNWC
jgi:hypothetical protein